MPEEAKENPFDRIMRELGVEDEARDKFREEAQDFYSKAAQLVIEIVQKHKETTIDELVKKGEAVAIMDMIKESLDELMKVVSDYSPYTQKVIAHQIAETIGSGFTSFMSLLHYLADMAAITSMLSDVLPDKCGVSFIITGGQAEEEKKGPSMN